MKKTIEREKLFVLLEVVVAVIFAVSLLFFAVCMDSVETYRSGMTGYGAVLLGDGNGVELRSEKIAFDGDADGITSVTANYGFYNPADEDVTVRLAFPYDVGNGVSATDTTDCTVTANGESVKTTVRHTYAGTAKGFYANEQKNWLVDDYRELRTALVKLAPYTPVARYDFEVNITGCESGYADFISDTGRGYYYLSGMQKRVKTNGHYRIGKNVSDGGVITVYVIGGRISDSFPEWKLYMNSRRKKEISGTLSALYKREITFEEYIAANYVSSEAGAAGVSFTDYYNASVQYLYYNNHLGYVDKASVQLSDLVSWREYELTVPAGAGLSNAVTTPISPSVDETRRPAVYGYRYEPGDPTTTKRFGECNVTVNTPQFIVKSDKLVRDSDGKYVANCDYVPGTLEFRLCSSAKPKGGGKLAKSPGACVSLGFVIASLVAGIALVVVILYDRLRSRKEA